MSPHGRPTLATASPALGGHTADWTALGRFDPLWAIMTEPAMRGRRWDRRAFLATGEPTVASLLERAEALGLPARQDSALDVGCGVGRLTLPLAARFRAVTGVDIAAPMIESARELARAQANVDYRLIDASAPLPFADRTFDLVLCIHVLQHMPTRELALAQLAGLARVVAEDGLLVVQLAGRLPLRHRLQLRRRAYAALHRAGIGDRVLFDRLGLHPMRLTGVAQADVREALARAGMRVVGVDASVLTGSRIDSFTYYATPGGSSRATAAPH